MKRNIIKQLVSWKSNKDRMPLLLRGARQVGKTYAIEYFGKNYFRNTVTLNLELQPELKSCFKSLRPELVIQAIEIITQQTIVSGETLLFIDEIQECTAAIKMLRYFKEQYPQLHVIAAGSLLEFVLNDSDFSMPVGRVEFMFLYPLTFSEFLIALGDEKLCDYLSHVELTDRIPEAIHQKALERLKLYFVLGGMPAVVSSYVNYRDLQRCQELQAFVLSTYRNDFGKYASMALQQHCRRVFEKTPNLIAKRFKYVDVDPDVQSRRTEESANSTASRRCNFPCIPIKSYRLAAQCFN